jgi:hypothetical protein
MKPQLIRAGKNILNLANVQRMTVEGPNRLNVYLMPHQELVQFGGEEAQALLAALEDGYITNVRTEPETSRIKT